MWLSVLHKRDQFLGLGVSCIKLYNLSCCTECFLMSYLFTDYLALNIAMFLHATRDMKVHGLIVILIETTLDVLNKLGKTMPDRKNPPSKLVHVKEDLLLSE